MKWTRERPVRTGWYWAKRYNVVHMVEVVWTSGPFSRSASSQNIPASQAMMQSKPILSIIRLYPNGPGHWSRRDKSVRS